MKIAVVNENRGFERRVALVPATVSALVKQGWSVTIESGAGLGAVFSDEAFREAGATIESDRTAILTTADLLVKVGAPTPGEMAQLRSGQIVIGFVNPLGHPQTIGELKRAGGDGFQYGDGAPYQSGAINGCPLLPSFHCGL
jgi:NAD(P) transhydrogenase subunit alpha